MTLALQTITLIPENNVDMSPSHPLIIIWNVALKRGLERYRVQEVLNAHRDSLSIGIIEGGSGVVEAKNILTFLFGFQIMRESKLKSWSRLNGRFLFSGLPKDSSGREAGGTSSG
jgi:hypothetical protein